MSLRRRETPARRNLGRAMALMIAVPVLQGCSCVSHSDRLVVGFRPPSITRLTECDLRDRPNPELTSCARRLGFFTTPFKRLGILGWRDLGMDVVAVGRVEQVATSTDRFLTADLRLAELSAGWGQVELRDKRFLRAEVCLRQLRLPDAQRPCRGDLVRIAGRLMWDADGRGFLEVHPQSVEDVEILEPGGQCP